MNWEEFHRSEGIFTDRKNNPSTSCGRYYFPRYYYESDGDRPGLSGPGVPSGDYSCLEANAEAVLSARLGENSFSRNSDGWLQVGHVLVHPDDTTVAMYSDTVLKEDPMNFVPDPREHENGIVTKWGITDFTTNHDVLASAIMRQDNVASSLYSEEATIAPTMQFIKVLEQRKLNFLSSNPVQTVLSSTYVLKIELCENESSVWRRIRVPASIDLSKFDDQVIIPTMGWSRCYKSHVFEDPKDGSVFGNYPSKGKYPGQIDGFLSRLDYYYTMDERSLPLVLLLHNVGDSAYYTHDLSEQWVHRITVEDILRDCEDGSISLLDGSGACPPEDGAGVEARGCLGYAEFLRAYKKNPRKPKVKEAVKAMSSSHNHGPSAGSPNVNFNPFHFDIYLQRQILEKAIAGPSLRIKGPLLCTKLRESTRGCASCKNRLKVVKECARCGKVAYCSRKCQAEDWNEGGHKKVCNRRNKHSSN